MEIEKSLENGLVVFHQTCRLGLTNLIEDPENASCLKNYSLLKPVYKELELDSVERYYSTSELTRSVHTCGDDNDKNLMGLFQWVIHTDNYDIATSRVICSPKLPQCAPSACTNFECTECKDPTQVYEKTLTMP